MLNNSFSKKLRSHIGINGLLSLIAGLLILFWPGRSAAVVTILIGISFAMIGLFYIITSISASDESGWGRFGHLLLGALYLVAGIFSFINLAATTTYLFLFIGIFVGITWLVEGFTAFGMVQYSTSKGWTIFSAILSVLAGLSLLFTPFLGAAFLWILLGISLVVLGAIKIIRYFIW